MKRKKKITFMVYLKSYLDYRLIYDKMLPLNRDEVKIIQKKKTFKDK